MYFLIEQDDLLGKYNAIWDKVNADFKKDFESEPAYIKSFLKNKIKSSDDKVTDFYNKELPNVASNHIFLTVISLNSILRKDEKCYPQVFLNKCKYILKS